MFKNPRSISATVIFVLVGLAWLIPSLQAQGQASISRVSPLFFEANKANALLKISGNGFNANTTIRFDLNDKFFRISKFSSTALEVQFSPNRLPPGVFRFEVLNDGKAVPLDQRAPRFYSRDATTNVEQGSQITGIDITLLGRVARNLNDTSAYIQNKLAVITVDRNFSPTPASFTKKVGALNGWKLQPLFEKQTMNQLFQPDGPGVCGQTMIALFNNSATSMAQRLNDLATTLSSPTLASVVFNIDPFTQTGHPVQQALSESLVSLEDTSYKDAFSAIRAQEFWDDTGRATMARAQIDAMDGPVAVIDTGVSPHPEFLSNQLVNPFNLTIDPSNNAALERERNTGGPIWPGPSLKDANDFWHGPAGMQRIGHGTAVAGVIASRDDTPKALSAKGFNTNTFVVGVAAGAKVMPIRVCDAEHLAGCQGPSVVAGICTAVSQGAKTINLSLSGLQATRTLELALRAAAVRNIPIVAAAGNKPLVGRLFPAAYSVNRPSEYNKVPGLISVGAVNRLGAVSSFSPRTTSGVLPDWVSLSAPGGDSVINEAPHSTGGDPNLILVAGLTGTVGGSPASWYWKMNGTSVAAPFVTGTATLLRAKCPAVSSEQIKQWIVGSAMAPNRLLNVSAAILASGCP